MALALIPILALWSWCDWRWQRIPRWVTVPAVAIWLVSAWLGGPTISPGKAVVVFCWAWLVLDLPGGDRDALGAVALFLPSWGAVIVLLCVIPAIGTLALLIWGRDSCLFQRPFFPYYAGGIVMVIWLGGGGGWR